MRNRIVAQWSIKYLAQTIMSANNCQYHFQLEELDSPLRGCEILSTRSSTDSNAAWKYPWLVKYKPAFTEASVSYRRCGIYFPARRREYYFQRCQCVDIYLQQIIIWHLKISIKKPIEMGHILMIIMIELTSFRLQRLLRYWRKMFVKFFKISFLMSTRLFLSI